MESEGPIGIFDSGIGGLTVASSISELLPNEQIIYFGDTQHLPYGIKSFKRIKEYCSKIVKFLLDKNCKAIVIACNSASAAAYLTINQQVQKKALVFNVIDPVIDYIKNTNTIKHVGVIGTNATIDSNVYTNKIKSVRNDVNVSSLATPLLATLIEENSEKIFTKGILNSYLKNQKLTGIDSLILGCTHYPLISQKIDAFFNSKIEIINSIDHVKKEIQTSLQSKKLLNKNSKKSHHHFYISDYTENFQKKTKLFFSSKIILEEVNIF